MNSNRRLSGRRRLEINGTNINIEYAKEIGKLISSCSELKSVSLVKCSLTSLTVFEISSALNLNTTLLKLNLRGNLLEDKGTIQLIDCLKSNKTLSHMFLCNNNISINGAKAISVLLSQDECAIVNFNLGHNLLGEIGAKLISSSIKKNKNLEDIDIGYNNIGDSGISEFAEALLCNTTIKSFYCNSNEITNEGISMLSLSLSENRSVNLLSVSENKFGPLGAQSLSKMLKINSSLTVLQMHNTDIMEAGGIAIADALLTNASLKLLDLKFNQIGDIGVEMVGTHIEKASALTCIYLGSPNITIGGIKSFIKLALKSDSQLKTLDFYGSSIQGSQINPILRRYLIVKD